MSDEHKYTKYEKARMIGSRALQLSMGAPFLVKLNEAELTAINFDPIEIAMLEFDEGVLPISVKRPKKAALFFCFFILGFLIIEWERIVYFLGLVLDCGKIEDYLGL